MVFFLTGMTELGFTPITQGSTGMVTQGSTMLGCRARLGNKHWGQDEDVFQELLNIFVRRPYQSNGWTLSDHKFGIINHNNYGLLRIIVRFPSKSFVSIRNKF